MEVNDFIDFSRQSLSIKPVCPSTEQKYAGRVKDQSGQKNTFSALLLLFAKYDFSKENKDLAHAVSQVAGNGQEPSFDGLCSMFDGNRATLYFAMINTSRFAEYFFWHDLDLSLPDFMSLLESTLHQFKSGGSACLLGLFRRLLKVSEIVKEIQPSLRDVPDAELQHHLILLYFTFVVLRKTISLTSYDILFLNAYFAVASSELKVADPNLAILRCLGIPPLETTSNDEAPSSHNVPGNTNVRFGACLCGVFYILIF